MSYSLGYQSLHKREEGSGNIATPALCSCPECGHGQSGHNVVTTMHVHYLLTQCAISFESHQNVVPCHWCVCEDFG